MKEKILKEIRKSKDIINKCQNLEDLKQAKSRVLNKNDVIFQLKSSFKNLSKEKLKQNGILLQQYSKEINFSLMKKEKDLKLNLVNENLKKSKENIDLSCYKEFNGTIHPLNLLVIRIKEIFEKMGYIYIDSFEIETTKVNFDDLNIDVNHPSRDKSDTFYINKNTILRPHCTNMTIRELKKRKEDIKIFTIGNTYRNDSDDPTHSHQFMQIDFFNVSKEINLNVKNLKWTLNFFLKKVFNDVKLKTRFRPSYFPFTTPSYEVDISCTMCKGKGCNVCKDTGYVEILGAGMLHPNVISNIEKDPNQYQGFAAGIGLERIAMLLWNIKDIRLFYENNYEFLKQFKGKW